MARAATFCSRASGKGGRTTSKLPALIDLVFERLLVSSDMIAEGLGVTPRAAHNLVATLELPETSGRGRYRVWGNFLTHAANP